MMMAVADCESNIFFCLKQKKTVNRKVNKYMPRKNSTRKQTSRSRMKKKNRQQQLCRRNYLYNLFIMCMSVQRTKGMERQK